MILSIVLPFIVGAAIAIPIDAYGRRRGWGFGSRLLLTSAACALVAVAYLVAVS